MRRISILTYHSLDIGGSVVSIEPGAFAGQMASLASRGFRGISLREAINHRTDRGSWPEDRVVITFDDGYANMYEEAMPALAKHGFTATVFIVSGHIGGYNDWTAPPAGLGKRAMLTWEQVSNLAAAGIEIGAHTRNHPDLRGLSPPESEDEIVASREEIENRLGQTVESFAFPYGHTSRDSMEIVRREFRAACNTRLRRASDEALHQLPRVDMYYLRSPRQFQRLLEDRLDNYLAVRQWGRLVRGALAAD
jgi:peptidoglycan/xylan/chitin deacetylase (PgdA/CDA1 family)